MHRGSGVCVVCTPRRCGGVLRAAAAARGRASAGACCTRHGALCAAPAADAFACARIHVVVACRRRFASSSLFFRIQSRSSVRSSKTAPWPTSTTSSTSTARRACSCTQRHAPQSMRARVRFPSLFVVLFFCDALARVRFWLTRRLRHVLQVALHMAQWANPAFASVVNGWVVRAARACAIDAGAFPSSSRAAILRILLLTWHPLRLPAALHRGGPHAG